MMFNKIAIIYYLGGLQLGTTLVETRAATKLVVPAGPTTKEELTQT